MRLFDSAGFSTCNFINGRAQASVITQAKRILQKIIHGAVWTQHQNSLVPSSRPSTSSNSIAILVNRRIARKLTKKRCTCERSQWTIRRNLRRYLRESNVWLHLNRIRRARVRACRQVDEGAYRIAIRNSAGIRVNAAAIIVEKSLQAGQVIRTNTFSLHT